jgi:cell division protein FtsL
MKTRNSSTLELCVNLFHHLFYKKNLIIFIGRNGLTLVALNKRKVIDSIFVKSGSEKYYKKYRHFLNLYKQYNILFLLDNKDCELKHEMLPVLSSLIKSNPIDKFIAEKYAPEDIVAYNVYEINNKNGEIWNTCIASSEFLPLISEILEHIVKKSCKYSGMYFLSLEFGAIINRILQITNHTNCANDLQIFVTITRASDIKIIVKYRENIMSEQSVEYPNDKSDMYILGTIEQAITDKLLFYRDYIKKLNLKVCIISLLDNQLNKLVRKTDFGIHQVIAVSPDNINTSTKLITYRFQDLTILEIFDNTNAHLAFNKPLRSITKLTLVNSIMFKPIIAILAAMIFTLSFLKYQSLEIQGQIKELNNRHYSISQEYRNIKSTHPQLSNISNLIDLYNLERIVNRVSATPYEHIKNLISIQNKNIKIKNLSWKIEDPILVDMPDSNLTISMDIYYEEPLSPNMQEDNNIIDGYAVHLESVFYNYKVAYVKKFNETYEVAKRITLPVNFVITGKVGERNNAG